MDNCREEIFSGCVAKCTPVSILDDSQLGKGCLLLAADFVLQSCMHVLLGVALVAILISISYCLLSHLEANSSNDPQDKLFQIHIQLLLVQKVLNLEALLVLPSILPVLHIMQQRS